MLQQDYIMRLIGEFMNTLSKLIRKKRENGEYNIQSELDSLYRSYFNHDAMHFYKQDIDLILNELRLIHRGNELLTYIEMLSELLYQDAQLKHCEEKKNLLLKTLYLLEYLNTHTNTFSIERWRRINEIKAGQLR